MYKYIEFWMIPALQYLKNQCFHKIRKYFLPLNFNTSKLHLSGKLETKKTIKPELKRLCRSEQRKNYHHAY